MANLIIKSSADNLVLQGSGQSGSDPAITVAAAGTTTFAENATLSGTANNLGTTTAGTLSSGVTFPAGHIIQIVNNQGYADQTFGTGVDTIRTATITNVLASSICIVLWNVNVYNSLASAGFEGYIFRDSTNLHTFSGTNSNAVCFIAYTSATGAYHQAGGTIQDPSPTTGTNVYTLKGSAYSTGAITIAHDGMSSLTVMEVAQ